MFLRLTRAEENGKYESMFLRSNKRKQKKIPERPLTVFIISASKHPSLGDVSLCSINTNDLDILV